MQGDGGPLQGVKYTGDVDAAKLDAITEFGAKALRGLKIDQFIKEKVDLYFEARPKEAPRTREALEAKDPEAPEENPEQRRNRISGEAVAERRRTFASRSKWALNWQTGKDMGEYSGVRTRQTSR